MGPFSSPSEWIFRVEGFGEVGYANLASFIPLPHNKQPRDLAVGEMSEGKAAGETIRIWRKS